MFEDIVAFTLVDPGTDYYVPNERHMHGFMFRSATTGTFNVLTLHQFQTNGGDALRVGTPTQTVVNAAIDVAVAASKNTTIQLLAGQWTDTPIAWVDATNAADLAINVGLY